MPARLYSNCGTANGYRRHMREKTDTCPGCRKAIAKYMKQWRHQNGHSKARLIPDTILNQHGIKVNA